MKGGVAVAVAAVVPAVAARKRTKRENRKAHGYISGPVPAVEDEPGRFEEGGELEFGVALQATWSGCLSGMEMTMLILTLILMIHRPQHEVTNAYENAKRTNNLLAMGYVEAMKEVGRPDSCIACPVGGLGRTSTYMK